MTAMDIRLRLDALFPRIEDVPAAADFAPGGGVHPDGTRLPFLRILDNLLLVARERPIVVQSLFLTLDGVGPDDTEIAAWAKRLREITAQGGRIDHVQVYTVARAPSDPRCGSLDPARLEGIAAAARAAGLTAAVYA